MDTLPPDLSEGLPPTDASLAQRLSGVELKLRQMRDQTVIGSVPTTPTKPVSGTGLIFGARPGTVTSLRYINEAGTIYTLNAVSGTSTLDRIIISNSSPHITLVGDVIMNGQWGNTDAGSLTAGYYGQISFVPANTAGNVGLGVYLGSSPSSPTTSAAVGLQGKAYANAAATVSSVFGLDYIAGATGLGAGAYALTEVTGIRLQHLTTTSAGLTITAMNGVSLQAPSFVGNQITAVTTYTGFKMAASASAKLATVIGFFFGSFSNAANIPIPLDMDGPARTTDTAGSVHRMNFQFGSRTRSFGTGDGVIGIADRTTAPSTNPAGGGVMYSEAGALKWRGSAGTVTVLAAA